MQKLLQQAAMNEDIQLLYAVEEQLIEAGVLKFLIHRQHVFYMREDLPFHNIHFDQHGKIDYREISPPAISSVATNT